MQNLGWIIALVIIVILLISVLLFLKSKVFGALPEEGRYSSSPNYKNGAFRNLEVTQMMVHSTNMNLLGALWKFLNKPKDTEPPRALPLVKTDLKNLNYDAPAIVWFGHSSYIISYKGINILVDPVFSGRVSPVPVAGKAFKGTNYYQVEHMPEIDILILTHDHYDHLDYKTIIELHPKVKKIYTSLGVSPHLLMWGVDAREINEMDWNYSENVSDNIKLTALTSRHFSGRQFTRNQSLWNSFALEFFGYKIYLGGDSGYGKHFKEIISKHGPFDLALIECAQYGEGWPYIHMTPEQSLQAAMDINTKVLFPVHWAKFALALHPWDEPIKRLLAANINNEVEITTPMIGEVVVMNKELPKSKWWERV